MTTKTSRRDFLGKVGKGVFALGAAHLCRSWAAGTPGKKPNVLTIVVDDLRTELGCYGAAHIKSPNIDRLASGGLLFSKAYVQQAICAASRASFLTGCRPDTTGVDFPYTKWFRNEFLKSHPDIQTYFHKHGYYTATCGKIHHGHYDPACSEPHYYTKMPKWMGENYQPDGPKPCVEFLDKPDGTYMDGDLTNMALKWLQKASGKKEPFFLAVGYRKPHLPFVCPQKYAGLYKREKIELSPVPQFPENSPAYSHHGVRHRDKNGNWVLTGKSAIFNKRYTQNPGGLTADYRRELKHGYYACVSFIDAQVGRLMDALKKLGLWDNTIILLWSDHGYHLGDHNWWTKGNNCEFDTRTPLIIRVPGQKNGGQKTSALIETVDIFPTLLDACGFPVPDYMEGTGFMPLVEKPRRQWKKAELGNLFIVISCGGNEGN